MYFEKLLVRATEDPETSNASKFPRNYHGNKKLENPNLLDSLLAQFVHTVILVVCDNAIAEDLALVTSKTQHMRVW